MKKQTETDVISRAGKQIATRRETGSVPAPVKIPSAARHVRAADIQRASGFLDPRCARMTLGKCERFLKCVIPAKKEVSIWGESIPLYEVKA